MGTLLVWGYVLLATASVVAWWALWRPRGLPGVVPREPAPPGGSPRPLLLGHRGTRGVEPENTLAAFRRALDDGLDGVEFDVQRASDGALIITHDADVDGVAIASLDSAALRLAIPGLPTLGELFELAREYPGRLLNLEIKAEGWRTQGLERAVVAAVRASGLAERVLVSSFNPVSLARVRLHAPQLRVALLYAPEMPRWLRDGALAPVLHVDALHPHHSQVTADLMGRARARRVPVNTWTVNDADEVRRLWDLGVEGIIADDPTALRQAAAQAQRAT